MVAVYHGAALVGHWYGVKPLLSLTSFGFSGVHLFFVISGMIIFHAHYADFGHVRNAWAYLLKRLVRVYPLYWIVFLVVAGWTMQTTRMGSMEFLTNALLFSSDKPLIVAVAWTLAYEMLFYGMFVSFIISKRMGTAVFAAWFTLIALNHYLHFSSLIALSLINILFMAGILTSAGVMSLRDRLGQNARDLLGIFGLVSRAAILLVTATWYVALDVPESYVYESLLFYLGLGGASALLLLASVSPKSNLFSNGNHSLC
jgi:peptidoglycan/LPS O-acetylase OafA/YrhL